MISIISTSGKMKRFRYTIHNIIGHPLMEIFSLLGMHEQATWIHDITLPKIANKNTTTLGMLKNNPSVSEVLRND